jgi:hypothetical protein
MPRTREQINADLTSTTAEREAAAPGSEARADAVAKQQKLLDELLDVRPKEVNEGE